ncbi:hypothetical protein [Acidovorax sp. sic0104]|uniref:hypothetical protein n=1 Tax=Acidovorax sp. sic0104 TaxID=2854784 RepID=UPI001C44CBB6|nr:hypothetical protein [Acidovorax sp. sic0104]MBV7543801.1 hypothetical protein [Acidovorax sp. sic0104]
MRATTLAMLLSGAANLLPALFFMFTVLLGSNGMNSTQGGRLLGAIALLLALGWVAGLFLARHMAQWCMERGWSGLACVAAAGAGTVAIYTVMAVLATFMVLLWVGA